MKGIMVNVYRPSGGDGTNGGVTASHDRLLLVGPGVPQAVEPWAGSAILTLVRRTVFGKEHLQAEPIEPARTNRMFGGNFIFLSGNGFPSDYPIPVHDREEPNRYDYD